MKGTIRTLVGLLIVFGAAGADVATPNTQVLVVAMAGLLLMISGTSAMASKCH